MAQYYLVCSEPYSDPGTGWACLGSESSIAVSLPFDASTLDPVAVVEAIGSGFIVAGVPLLVILVCRIILETIQKG